jgi:hypothetical protein
VSPPGPHRYDETVSYLDWLIIKVALEAQVWRAQKEFCNIMMYSIRLIINRLQMILTLEKGIKWCHRQWQLKLLQQLLIHCYCQSNWIINGEIEPICHIRRTVRFKWPFNSSIMIWYYDNNTVTNTITIFLRVGLLYMIITSYGIRYDNDTEYESCMVHYYEYERCVTRMEYSYVQFK